MTRQCYTNEQIQAVVKKVLSGAHLSHACAEMGFVYSDVQNQVARLGIAQRIQSVKRAVRRQKGLTKKKTRPPKPRKPKIRTRCSTCGVALSTGTTWAYCSKACETNRPAVARRSRSDKSCANCDAFCDGGPTSSYRFGTCRRYAPDVQFSGGWPKVRVTDWCMQWSPKAALANPPALDGLTEDIVLAVAAAESEGAKP